MKKSDRQIAEHVGVNNATVSKYRAQLVATVEIQQSTERTGRDGRTINTANIGKSIAVAMGRALEELERPDARKRQSQAGKQHGRGKIASGNFTEAIDKAETREKVGAAIGMSGPTTNGRNLGINRRPDPSALVRTHPGGSVLSGVAIF